MKQVPIQQVKPQQFGRVAVATLNQWAMDFETNKQNILESLQIAKDNKCSLRVGPELEITGYGCEDHFLELDTVEHSWQVLGEILNTDYTDNMLVDVGMPVYYKNCLYNCRLMLLNKQILLIRPKMHLADGGNYREPRFFTAWDKTKDYLEDFQLPFEIQQITNQSSVPIGSGLIRTQDTLIGYEICQEIWVPDPLNIQLTLAGCEIIINNSGSHYEMRKQKRRTDLIQNASAKGGGVYLYSNCRGVDGGRTYYDGNSIISQNGQILQMSDMFSLKEVDVMINDVDLHMVRQRRAYMGEVGEQSTIKAKKIPEVFANINVGNVSYENANQIIMDEKEYILQAEEEISWGPSCYMWDYLKRSGGMGYFLALSGGADSASSALIVYNMCKLAFESVQLGDQKVLQHLRNIIKDPEYLPQNPKEICGKILYTGYMGSDNSSDITRNRAKLLAEEIGSTHYDLSITDVYNSFVSTAEKTFGTTPKFKNQNGTWMEDIALQNIQARSRMILAYLMGGLIPWKIQKNGFLLVVGSANLDEGLRGYFTKYDCSSADINPIGSISKTDIKKFLQWNYEKNGIQAAYEILNAVPTAELRPLDDKKGIVQDDESDMGMTYDELKYYGYLRKVEKMGPLSMFRKLTTIWKDKKPEVIADKVKHFFKTYSQNRHKQTTLTPSYHVEAYGIDDNRFDLRQYLYNSEWSYQFKQIDLEVKKIKQSQKQ